MPIEVNLAKLSPTMESGQLVKWNVKVGDQVREGDVLAEVQTDKATMPMEAFDEGIVALLDVEEGADIELGQRVLVLAKKGEVPSEIAASMQGSGATSAASTQSAPPVAAVQSASATSDHTTSNGTNGQQSTATATIAPAPAPGGRIRSSPLARRIAKLEGIDLSLISGSGPNGRIIRRDVENFLENRGAAGTAPAAPSLRGPIRETKRIPHSPMRKTIAKRMLQSKQTAPEIHATVDVRMDQVLAIRERLNAQLAKREIKLSVGDFITKAVALALREHPEMNSSFEEDAMVLHGPINIGIAVALDGGLIVPVLANADQLGLVEIRQGTKAIAEAARSNTLKPEQMMGSTFTISNLGMYGIKQFDAILNTPEAGILAVGATEQRPVVENGQLAVGHVMTITLTGDHRAVDGATAAEFIRTLKGFLEEPASMLL